MSEYDGATPVVFSWGASLSLLLRGGVDAVLSKQLHRVVTHIQQCCLHQAGTPVAGTTRTDGVSHPPPATKVTLIGDLVVFATAVRRAQTHAGWTRLTSRRSL